MNAENGNMSIFSRYVLLRPLSHQNVNRAKPYIDFFPHDKLMSIDRFSLVRFYFLVAVVFICGKINTSLLAVLLLLCASVVL